MADGRDVLRVLFVVSCVALGELFVGSSVDLVGGAFHRGEATCQEGLPKAFGVLGEVGQADEAAEGLAEDGPSLLLVLKVLGQTQAHGLEVMHDTGGAEQLEVVGLLLGAALCKHRVRVDRGAEPGAAVVQVQDLVAAAESDLGQSMVLRFAVAEARPALEVDEIGQFLLAGEVRGGEGDDGPLMFPDAAAEQGQGASLRTSVVLWHLEKKLGDMELTWAV
jgi:hypothetical protein